MEFIIQLYIIQIIGVVSIQFFTIFSATKPIKISTMMIMTLCYSIPFVGLVFIGVLTAHCFTVDESVFIKLAKGYERV